MPPILGAIQTDKTGDLLKIDTNGNLWIVDNEDTTTRDDDKLIKLKYANTNGEWLPLNRRNFFAVESMVNAEGKKIFTLLEKVGDGNDIIWKEYEVAKDGKTSYKGEAKVVEINGTVTTTSGNIVPKARIIAYDGNPRSEVLVPIPDWFPPHHFSADATMRHREQWPRG